MRGVFERLARPLRPSSRSSSSARRGRAKELVAQAIHQASEPRDKPFVVVDCGAIPADLAEAARSATSAAAFTGAVDKRISPLSRQTGHHLLDELGELPVDVQPEAPRALAEQR